MRSKLAAVWTFALLTLVVASCGDDKTIDNFCARYAKACSNNPDEEKQCVSGGRDKEQKAVAADCESEFDGYVSCLDEAIDPCKAIVPCTDELAGCNIPP